MPVRVLASLCQCVLALCTVATLICQIPEPARASCPVEPDRQVVNYEPNIPGFPTSSPARWSSAVATVGNSQQVVVHGGLTFSASTNFVLTPLDDLFLFDLGTKTVTVLTQSASNRPSARSDHRAEWLDNQFVTCQGSSGSTKLNDCWKYDLTSGNWTNLPNVANSAFPAAMNPATSVDRDSQFFLTFGGMTGSNTRTNALWRVDPTGAGTAALVSSTGAVPSGRYGAVLVRKGATNAFLLMGGDAEEVYQLILSGLQGDWTLLNPSSTRPYGWDGSDRGIGMWDSARGVALYGYASFLSNLVYISDPWLIYWTPFVLNGTSVPTGRNRVGYTSVALANGAPALFGVGGYNSAGNPLSDAFLLYITVGQAITNCTPEQFPSTGASLSKKLHLFSYGFAGLFAWQLN